MSDRHGPIYEAAMCWLFLALMVACVGGTAGPFVLLGWWLGAFAGGGTLAGCGTVALGILFGLTFGIALMEKALDRWGH
jgi:hypothetical protein